MSNSSYQKGKRLEKKAEAWLQVLDPSCHRSFMSRGADLTFQWMLRFWKGSCKSYAKGKMRYRLIRDELETHDFCITQEDGDPFPMYHAWMPKQIEMLGKAEAEDATYLGDVA